MMSHSPSSLVSTLRGAVSARRIASTLTVLAGMAVTAAHAALPAQPAGAPANGTFLENMRDYIGMGIGLVALVLAGYAFLAVSGGAIAKFNEWRMGKAELGELKMVFIVGGLLLLVVIYLVTQAVGVIATSGTFAGA